MFVDLGYHSGCWLQEGMVTVHFSKVPSPLPTSLLPSDTFNSVTEAKQYLMLDMPSQSINGSGTV